MTLLDDYSICDPAPSFPFPCIFTVENEIVALEKAWIAFEEDPIDKTKAASEVYRTKRLLKTTLSDVVRYTDQILRCQDHLVAWPGYDIYRHPGGGPDSAARLPPPKRWLCPDSWKF